MIKARKTLAERSDIVVALERLGRERALIYKTLVLTGLRKGELASLTVGQLDLDAVTSQVAYARLNPDDEKNGQGNDIPLREDLANDLRRWLSEKLEAARAAATNAAIAISARLSSATPLFHLPADMIRVFDRDLAVAGIVKRDDRGRTVDVHAMRHTFGTHLSKGGVMPRTAQAAMRHSTLDLTMNTYTDPRLLDVASALNVLPRLPLEGNGAQQGRRIP